MSDYYYKNGRFVIENYDRKKPFSSFLPGIGGLLGIPIWAFYVNRGQGISSFGVRDKNGAILEFFPANCAYMYTDRIGFRTFIKGETGIYECFQGESDSVRRKMEISKSEFSLIEENQDLNLIISVTFFILPNEDFGGLVRKVEIQDLSGQKRTLEVLDGIAQILPSGISYGGYKAVSNLLRSWMDVTNLENHIAFYKLKATTEDSTEVKNVNDGNFYMSFSDGKLIDPLADPDLIFGVDTALKKPLGFQLPIKEIYKQSQITVNKVPCGFSGMVWDTGSKILRINTVIGYTNDIKFINRKVKSIATNEFIDRKQTEARKIIDELTSSVETKTAISLFDEYIRQNYLDNILRGGFPLIFENDTASAVYHVYSRKHGDLERDYNFFVTLPEYYSQGNGNFRDVCQNRRNDVLINPRVKDYNLYVFGSLIQADGYNPLGVNGSKFNLKKQILLPEEVLGNPDFQKLMKNSFSPGMLATCLMDILKNHVAVENLVTKIIASSEQTIEAEFGEGYWQDHWTYILDLLETFVSVYPDEKYKALFERTDYRYFSSPVRVRSRSEKYRLINGKVRQHKAVVPVEGKIDKWLSIDNQPIQTNLYSKLFVLALCKYASLDPYGIGISYEGDKPGWNDAMNGLPGLFGSGVGESAELYRLVDALAAIANQYPEGNVKVLDEFCEFFQNMQAIQGIKESFAYWDNSQDALEKYRESLDKLSGRETVILVREIAEFLGEIKNRLLTGFNKALEIGCGIVPTYLLYEANDYEILETNNSEFPNVKIKAFRQIILPRFLEAPARIMKIDFPKLNKEELHQNVKKSDLYDSSFGIYKTSEDLSSLSLEIGRIVAFSKGWFERESDFLHMTYKYLFGLLKAGLYEQFYEEIRTNFVCFMDPAVYGRSILENSSFLAPSNNPNPMIQGQGFVARLSGSTAEALSIWHLMFFGEELFTVKDGELTFTLSPKLNHVFFDDDGYASVLLFGNTEVLYHNPRHLDTYDSEAKIVSTTLISETETCVIEGSAVRSPLANRIRKGEFSKIKVEIDTI